MTRLMKLRQQPFEKIKNKQKVYELRLYDEKRRKINVGDDITFTAENGETLTVSVTEILVFPTFEQLYAALPPEKCGYAEGQAADFKDMYAYYTPEEEREHGVVAIGIKTV